MSECKKQQGGTLLGFLFLLFLVVLILLVGFRLFPLYYERFEVIKAVEKIAAKPDTASMGSEEVRRLFLRQINATSNISRFDRKNLKKYMRIEHAKKNMPKRIVMQYEIRRPFFENIELVMYFNEEFPMN